MRWYERPHDGAHATDVMANAGGAAVASASAACVVLLSGAAAAGACGAGAGAASRVSRTVGRRDGESCII